jgi:prepilin-type processing-associated H-X9-DG protein
MPTPLDSRKKPADVKIRVSTGEGVDITWADGHASHYDFPYLRDNCPCAMCNDEREKNKSIAAHGAGQSTGAHGAAQIPSQPSAFPMFKPKVTAKSAHAVGNYAVQILFSDGHSTGIYSFDHLREICPCPSCAAEFRATNR